MNEEDKIIFQRLIYYNDEEHLAKRIIELQHYNEDLQQELQRKDNIINELKNTLETCIYGIEPKGCIINYNCEYDSEEDYICAMQEQSRLNTYKFVLDKIKELENGKQ